MISCVWDTHDKKHDIIILLYHVFGGFFFFDKSIWWTIW